MPKKKTLTAEEVYKSQQSTATRREAKTVNKPKKTVYQHPDTKRFMSKESYDALMEERAKEAKQPEAKQPEAKQPEAKQPEKSRPRNPDTGEYMTKKDLDIYMRYKNTMAKKAEEAEAKAREAQEAREAEEAKARKEFLKKINKESSEEKALREAEAKVRADIDAKTKADEKAKAKAKSKIDAKNEAEKQKLEADIANKDITEEQKNEAREKLRKLTIKMIRRNTAKQIKEAKAKIDAKQPEAKQPEAKQPEAKQPEAKQPEEVKPEVDSEAEIIQSLIRDLTKLKEESDVFLKGSKQPSRPKIEEAKPPDNEAESIEMLTKELSKLKQESDNFFRELQEGITAREESRQITRELESEKKEIEQLLQDAEKEMVRRPRSIFNFADARKRFEEAKRAHKKRLEETKTKLNAMLSVRPKNQYDDKFPGSEVNDAKKDLTGVTMSSPGSARSMFMNEEDSLASTPFSQERLDAPRAVIPFQSDQVETITTKDIAMPGSLKDVYNLVESDSILPEERKMTQQRQQMQQPMRQTSRSASDVFRTGVESKYEDVEQPDQEAEHPEKAKQPEYKYEDELETYDHYEDDYGYERGIINRLAKMKNRFIDQDNYEGANYVRDIIDAIRYDSGFQEILRSRTRDYDEAELRFARDDLTGRLEKVLSDLRDSKSPTASIIDSEMRGLVADQVQTRLHHITSGRYVHSNPDVRKFEQELKMKEAEKKNRPFVNIPPIPGRNVDEEVVNVPVAPVEDEGMIKSTQLQYNFTPPTRVDLIRVNPKYLEDDKYNNNVMESALFSFNEDKTTTDIPEQTYEDMNIKQDHDPRGNSNNIEESVMGEFIDMQMKMDRVRYRPIRFASKIKPLSYFNFDTSEINDTTLNEVPWIQLNV